MLALTQTLTLTILLIPQRMLAGRVPFREASTHMLYSRIRAADYYMPDWWVCYTWLPAQNLCVTHHVNQISLSPHIFSVTLLTLFFQQAFGRRAGFAPGITGARPQETN